MAQDTASLKGRLLVAAPSLLDPNFFRTVVLLLDHDGDGAIGVVLNRPSDSAIDDALPGWDAVAAEPRVVFVGGPVQPEAAVCLAEPAGGETSGLSPLLEWAYSLDLSQDPALAAADVTRLRVFAGYAGWGPGQLEAEIAGGDWFVLPSLPDDAFGPAPDDLWARVLRRQPLPLRLVGFFPADPSQN